VARISAGEPDATAAFLAELAASHGVYVLGGVATLGPDGRGRNQALALSPASGESLPTYTKLHSFCLGGNQAERSHYTPGDVVTHFKWGHLHVAPFICYDLRFPEIFRRASRLGAEVMAVIANWPSSRVEHWLTLLRARAIENQCYVIGVNRCGRDPKIQYPGRSVIVDPHGVVVADAGHRECVIHARVDPGDILDYRREFPVLEDMRPDLTRLD
jgi:predicted amidohydrolase